MGYIGPRAPIPNGTWMPRDITNFIALGEWPLEIDFPAQVKLLMRFGGFQGGFNFNEIRGSAVTVQGPVGGRPTFVNTPVKFGDTSAFFSGSGYLDLSPMQELNLGSSDFTLEFWINREAEEGPIRPICSFGTTSQRGYQLLYHTDPYKLAFHYSTNGTDVQILESLAGGPSFLSPGNWHHVAVVKQSGNLFFFFRGTQIGMGQTIGTIHTVSFGADYLFRFGSQWDTALTKFRGNLQDFRLSVGIGRYNNHFRPSEFPFPRR